ncbi:hypothetical protein GJ496_004622 [Pomphorhynchus laevis]|nr:hypothetical protein GJ496_004622 [Pomphorhynchus laevis]
MLSGEAKENNYQGVRLGFLMDKSLDSETGRVRNSVDDSVMVPHVTSVRNKVLPATISSSATVMQAITDHQYDDNAIGEGIQQFADNIDCCGVLSDKLLEEITTEQRRFVIAWLKKTRQCINQKLWILWAQQHNANRHSRKKHRKTEQRLVLRRRAIMNSVRAQGFSLSAANGIGITSSRLDAILTRSLMCLRGTMNINNQRRTVQHHQHHRRIHQQIASSQVQSTLPSLPPSPTASVTVSKTRCSSLQIPGNAHNNQLRNKRNKKRAGNSNNIVKFSETNLRKIESKLEMMQRQLEDYDQSCFNEIHREKSREELDLASEW